MSRERARIDGKTPEQVAGQVRKSVLGVFTVREEWMDVNERLLRAREKATTEAPDGYVFRIVALSDGALTLVHDRHKPEPWYLDLERDRVVYAPGINCREGGIYTSPMSSDGIILPSSVVCGDPVRINNEDVEIGLTGIDKLMAMHERREVVHRVPLSELV